MKKSVILECIIVEYINNPFPIGSEQLRNSFDMGVSSSTIRNYFKQLSIDGALMQPHTSSGRIPTSSALRCFWDEKLSKIDTIKIPNIEMLEEASSEYKIPSIASFQKSNRLIDIINAKNRYIILAFEVGEIVVEYIDGLEIFLKSLIGIDVNELIKISLNLHIDLLTIKLREFVTEKNYMVFSEDEFSNYHGEWVSRFLIEFVAKKKLEMIDSGLYFDSIVPDGYIAFKKEFIVEDEIGWLCLVGKLSSNFMGFFDLLKKEGFSG